MLKPVRVSSTDHHKGRTYAEGEVIPYHLVPIGGCFKTPDGGIYQRWEGNIDFAYPLHEIEPRVYKIEYQGKVLDDALECTMIGDVKVFEEED